MRPCFVLRQQSDPAGTRIVILSPLIDTFLSGLLYLIRTSWIKNHSESSLVASSVSNRLELTTGNATYHPLSGFCHSPMFLSLRRCQSVYYQFFTQQLGPSSLLFCWMFQFCFHPLTCLSATLQMYCERLRESSPSMGHGPPALLRLGRYVTIVTLFPPRVLL